MEYVKLVNVAVMLREHGVAGAKSEEARKVLDTLPNIVGVETRAFTYDIGRGEAFFVQPELAEWMLANDSEWRNAIRTPRQRRAPSEQAPSAERKPIERIVDRLDPAFKAEIEEIIMGMMEKQQDLETQVDALHKSVGAMHATYLKLIAQVDPKANLPEPPPLPPRYLWKVLIVGGTEDKFTPHIERLRSNFRDVRILTLGRDKPSSKTTLPTVDAVFMMTNYLSHGLRDAALNRYPKEIVYQVSGTLSALEGALAMWTAERRKESE